ncbi:MAG: pyrroline-5-carboxylate reductase, partial [Treponema sp.]|nr:pyrroline-5-carboxylate reductase [Treponema sp.]
MKVTIACIGSGNMGNALMKGAARLAGGGHIGFADAEKKKAQEAAKNLGGTVYASKTEAVEKGDYIFLAVKPQTLREVLVEITPAIRQRVSGKNAPVLVSMAPGWTIGKIQALAGPQTPVVRIMPNTPALIAAGVIAMTPSREVPPKKAADLEKLLGAAGTVDLMEEKYLDAVTGLSGSGPAFVYLFIEALADGGVRAGLPRDKSLRFAAQTVLGAAAMVQHTGRHPG